MVENAKNEQVITVKDIDPRHRHMLIQQLFEHLTPEASLQLVVDHDPKPLYYQLEAEHPKQFSWAYLESGPVAWKVKIGRLPQ